MLAKPSGSWWLCAGAAWWRVVTGRSEVPQSSTPPIGSPLVRSHVEMANQAINARKKMNDPMQSTHSPVDDTGRGAVGCHARRYVQHTVRRLGPPTPPGHGLRA